MYKKDQSAYELQILFSIIIPTYQRRDLVLRMVRALAYQEFAGKFEVIVVVDGSTDGTVEYLKALAVPFSLTVLEQQNQGAAMARNNGASVARGGILLFLDDDMEAHPRMLTEHHLSYGEGAQVVLGHLPLHHEAPRTFLSNGIESWAADRLQQLTSSQAELTLHDLLTGQISMRREVFDELGGFDSVFTHGGSFGNEDVDFGYRLLMKGYKVVFNPNAISWQYYDVQPRDYLRKLYQCGQADVLFARKYPQQAETLFVLNGSRRKLNRYFWRPIQSLPFLASFFTRLLSGLTLNLLDREVVNGLTIRLFRETGSAYYWQGVNEKGGFPNSKSVTVLAYHAISDLPHGSGLEAYGVPPNQFQRQLDELIEAGYQFVDADELLRFLSGRAGLPHRALLLTFDDGYADLLTAASPALAERAIPAVVFAVSNLLGKTNEWDAAKGMPRLPLLDVDGLKQLSQNRFEIGAHSRTHQCLTRITGEELCAEINGSVSELESNGLGRPRLFAYPYGEVNEAVRQVVEHAGIQAAFTVRPGRVRRSQNCLLLPRIEVLKGDVGWKLRLKIKTAGHLFASVGSVKSLISKYLGG